MMVSHLKEQWVFCESLHRLNEKCLEGEPLGLLPARLRVEKVLEGARLPTLEDGCEGEGVVVAVVRVDAEKGSHCEEGVGERRHRVAGAGEALQQGLCEQWALLGRWQMSGIAGSEGSGLDSMM